MKKTILPLLFVMVCSALGLLCCSKVNTIPDPRFNEDGSLIKDSVDSVVFAPQAPQKIKFFVEVSGSMNGFFHANAPTDFKSDVWNILSYFSNCTEGVTILTNEGEIDKNEHLIPLNEFQTKMNTGLFVSSESTRVPLMLSSIINNLDTENGEVAVLISDMKYSPIGQAAPKVLLTQYSSDISKILGESRKGVSLIGAISNYLNKDGSVATPKSPYFVLIIGDGEKVTYMRNAISTLLDQNEHFIDNIDSGINYTSPTYSFGYSTNCSQMDDEPTFIQAQDDTCTIKLKVDLENYRWIMASEDYFKNAFKIKTTYGSNISVGNIDIEVNNITDKQLLRKATATVDIKLFDMAMDMDVLEWTLELPDTDYTLFAPYFGATTEDNVSKAFSVDQFIKGMFYGGVVNQTLGKNYILVSKKG